MLVWKWVTVLAGISRKLFYTIGDKHRLSGAMPQPNVHGHNLLLLRGKAYEESCSEFTFIAFILLACRHVCTEYKNNQLL